MSDEEVVEAFRLFLEGVGQPARAPLNAGLVDKDKVLAALDILDPDFAEKLSEKWAISKSKIGKPPCCSKVFPCCEADVP